MLLYIPFDAFESPQEDRCSASRNIGTRDEKGSFCGSPCSKKLERHRHDLSSPDARACPVERRGSKGGKACALSPSTAAGAGARQGFSGPAMLPMAELEYTGVTEKLAKLEKRFTVRAEKAVSA